MRGQSDAGIPLGLRGRPGKRSLAAALVRLRGALGDTGWDAAYADYWRALGSEPPPVLPPPDGRVNWVWLTDLDEAGRAVDLGSPFGEIASTLALDVPEVAYLGERGDHLELAARRFEDRSSAGRIDVAEEAAEAASDLVVFVASPGWRARLPGWARAAGPAVAAHRLLRTGGWFGALVGNPLGGTRLARWPRPAGEALADARALREVRRGIGRAGYAEVREYWCAAGFDVPEVLVPRRLAAVRAYAAIAGMSGQRARLLARGITAPLFPCILLLARK